MIGLINRISITPVVPEVTLMSGDTVLFHRLMTLDLRHSSENIEVDGYS
jgi:hypothetical protein